MANLTNAYEKILLDGLTGVTPWTTPTTVYLALLTADPTETGSVTSELSGDGYTRIALTGMFSAATSEVTVSTDLIESAEATADWPTLTHVGYCVSGTPGTDDMMLHDAMSVGINISNGAKFSIAIGDASITAA